jgi:hypothetical protein
MNENDMINFLKTLEEKYDIVISKEDIGLINTSICIIESMMDERDSAWQMLDEIKCSEIEKHSELVVSEIQKIQDDLKSSKQKFAKVSEA